MRPSSSSARGPARERREWSRRLCRAITAGTCLLALNAFSARVHAQPAPGFPSLRLIAPAAPGGGWDQTARAMQLALTQAGIVETSSVDNIPGAAGTIGLARFVSAEHGRGDVLMVSGLIMLSAIATHRSPITLGDVTPIARLTGEFEVIVVPTSSPYRTLGDLLDAFRAHPESVSWGGGSAGGTDHILAGLIADAAGVLPRRVNYIAFAGGGESMAAIAGGQVTVAISGVGEFAPQIEAGALRVLAVTSAERLSYLDAPTLREQGLDIVLENWRSIVAPPGITPADRERLERAVSGMVASRPWREALRRYQWNDRYLSGPAFVAFVDSEEARVQAILRKLGTGDAQVSSLTGAGPYPWFVLGGLGVCSVMFLVNLLRARTRSTPATPPPGFVAVALTVAAIVLDLALMERAGFVVASSLLFWLTARAFDARHPLRDAGFAIGVALAAYVLFARLLQLSLPAGVLARWM